MAIIIKETDKRVLEFLADFLRASVHGQCYAFAIALHRGLDWPIIGLMADGVIVHAGVRSPKGSLWDGRGENSEEDFSRPFKNKDSSYSICDVAEKKLMDTDAADERLIDFLRGKAQVVWSDLPWKENDHQNRIIEFLKKVEAASREHGCWIGGTIPTMLPVIFPGYGDETGYEASLTSDGSTYTFNRAFNP